MRWEKQAHAHTGLEDSACKVCGTQGFTATGMGSDAGGHFFFLLGRKERKKGKKKTAKETNTMSCNCPLPKMTAL